MSPPERTSDARNRLQDAAEHRDFLPIEDIRNNCIATFRECVPVFPKWDGGATAFEKLELGR